MSVALRAVSHDDYDVLFELMRDPESVWMAAFTSDDPNDRPAFEAWMARNASSPGVTSNAVTYRGELVGTIASFVDDGETEITYWIDRAYWGRGIASQAVSLHLEAVAVRPIRAREASDNVRSLRVLEKAGFQAVGTEMSFAAARGIAIEETILELRKVS